MESRMSFFCSLKPKGKKKKKKNLKKKKERKKKKKKKKMQLTKGWEEMVHCLV
jgi:hypothetical protein